ncbi:MAG: exodeoxyribonuclease III [Rhodospirillaceae bacterium]
MLTIATWNVNSVKARLPVVAGWLDAARPDILLLQELKGESAAFPGDAFAALGYQGAVVGQKAYNGVALLARRGLALTDVITALPGDPEDLQARYVEATVAGLRLASLYLPNGNPVASEKYPYKLRWLARLRDHGARLLAAGGPVVLGGDFNIIPGPEDVYAPAEWADDALFRPDSRRAFRALLHLGFTDAFRALHPAEPRAWTFWDYQAGRWPRDQGLRIDHFLLSAEAADRLESCTIDRAPRGLEKASDHTPVVLTLRSSGR